MASAASDGRKIISTLRGILREVRITDRGRRLENKNVRHLLDQYKQYSVTQSQLCKAPHEMQHLASTYSSYLTHSRRLQELRTIYSPQRGDVDVRKAAALVGLRPPDKHDSAKFDDFHEKRK